MNRFQKWLPIIFGIFVLILIGIGVYSWHSSGPAPGSPSESNQPSPTSAPSAAEAQSATPGPALSGSPSPLGSSSPVILASPTQSGKLDLTVDANGMSKATVIMNTTQGVIKFKLYPRDAPNTVNRFVELAQKGFYNGLAFHRAIENFIIQTGDPTGSGTGGSGQKLKAEFNGRRHLEGAVAMARSPSDPDSADSQFYITLSAQPRLDRNYTVFGQVIDGMDSARKIKVGDKVNSISFE